MNGVGTRKGYGFEPERPGPFSAVQPSADAMVEGYRLDALNGFEKEKPRFNPRNPERPQSSPLVDLKDPIQVHLLTETALTDSKEWEILSQEEVDGLKRQSQSLTQRIEQTRANLAIQSKYRDAAISMSKLYSTGGKRRSLLGNRNSGGSDNAREADAERQACERRCEELATELFSLEKRLMEPQMRLLQHTAGILQLTHRGSKRPATQANGQPLNGIPGSPESLYTYSVGRNSLDPTGEDSFFDERSLYISLDQFESGGGVRPKKNTIEIPMKSPVRKETMELREESDRLREENGRLQEEVGQVRASNDAMNLELQALERESAGQVKIISDTGRKLDGFNARIRDVIVSLNPTQNGGYGRPPSGNLQPEELVGSQLQYLDDAIGALQQSGASAGTNEAEIRLDNLNQQMCSILLNANPNMPEPPEPAGAGLDDQLNWLQDALSTINDVVARSGDKAKAEQTDTVLVGLWEIIQSGLAEMKARKEGRRKTRLQMGLGQDDEDTSGDESSVNVNEPYSLQAFSAKVQWLYAQATNLKEQKWVLKRQIKQQRELNNKSESEQKVEAQKMADDLQQMATRAKDAEDKLTAALRDAESTRKMASANESAAMKASQDQVKERNTKITTLENESKSLQTKLTKLDTEISSLKSQLATATTAQKAAESSAAAAAADASSKDTELEQLNAMVVELKTEATIAKAELEGAYGSRAQRAADVAKLTSASERDEMQGNIDTLKAELASTLKEFEDLTRDTISAEREKLELEGKLDDALAVKAQLEGEGRMVREKLEAEVARLQEELDAEKLKVGSVGAGGAGAGRGAGAAMLSEQFRATMKEERKKFQEEMRAEQAQRRKLEDEIRTLRRAAGPGKSALNPR